MPNRVVRAFHASGWERAGRQRTPGWCETASYTVAFRRWTGRSGWTTGQAEDLAATSASILTREVSPATWRRQPLRRVAEVFDQALVTGPRSFSTPECKAITRHAHDLVIT